MPNSPDRSEFDQWGRLANLCKSEGITSRPNHSSFFGQALRTIGRKILSPVLQSDRRCLSSVSIRRVPASTAVSRTCFNWDGAIRRILACQSLRRG